MDDEFDERAPKAAPSEVRPPIPTWGPPPSRPTSVGLSVMPPPPGPAAGPIMVPDPIVQPDPGPEPPEGPMASPGPTGSAGPVGSNRSPAAALTRADLAVAAAAALLFTVGLQGRPGSVVTLAGTGCVAAGIWLRRPARRRPTVALSLAAALGAAVLVVLRASPWVAGPAFVLLPACLVVASRDWLRVGSSVPAVALGFTADAVAATRRFAGPILAVGRARSLQRPVLRGGLLAAALLVPLTWLLASADPIFGRALATGIVGRTAWNHLLLTLVLAPLTAGLILGAGRDSAPQHQSPRPPKPGSMVEATIVFSAVILLLGAWGVTQVVVALGGAGHLLAAVDLTAAEHARRGFFQLVAVVAILLMVVVAVDRTVARRTVDDRRRFLALTTVLGLETLGLALASHRRLTLYIDGFGHTMLRTAVVWFLAWLVVAMAVVIVVMNRPGGRWFRVGPALFVLGGVWVLAFGASNPEATVAAANLERQATVELDGVPAVELDGVPAVELDRGYLVGDLGADAVPAIVDRLASQDRSTADWLTGRLCRQADRYRIDRPADWNRANAEARAAIESLDCDRLSPQD